MRKGKYRQAAACFLTAALVLSGGPVQSVLAETETSSETVQQEIPEEESTVSVTPGTEVPKETEPQTVPLTEQNTEIETQVEAETETQTEQEMQTEKQTEQESENLFEPESESENQLGQSEIGTEFRESVTEKETPKEPLEEEPETKATKETNKPVETPAPVKNKVLQKNAVSPQANNVASVTIGETTNYYTDMVSAFKAANGQTATVTLLQNTVQTSTINISSGTITFDGNNCEVTYGSGLGFIINSGATVIARNMNYLDEVMGFNIYGTLIMESGYIGYVNGVFRDGNVIIKGGTINQMNISGGTVQYHAPTPSIDFVSVKAGSITVKPLDAADIYGDARYKLTDKNGKVIYDWQDSNEFSNLSSNTVYKVYAKYAGNASYMESEEAVAEVTSAVAVYHIKIPATLRINDANSAQIGVDTEQSFDLGNNGHVSVKINCNDTLASDGTLTLKREGANDTVTSTLYVNNKIFKGSLIADFTMANKDTEKAVISSTEVKGSAGADIPAGTYKGTISFEVSYSE